jgi:RNA polymerase sigma factor for flagellar operon FliA
MGSLIKKSQEELDKLWKEYKATGDPRLKNQLAEEYLPVVRYHAERLAERLPNNVQVEDIASAGIFGLLDAIDKFDLSRGVKFETYCAGRIRGAMLDELRAMDWVPRQTRARANRLEQTYARLEKEHGRPPTDMELAEALGVSLEELDAIYKDVSGASVASLQRRSHAKEEDLLAVEIREDARIEGPLDAAARKDFLEYVQKNLTAKERYILMLYYFDELTLKEIGAILGLSESRVCQIHARVLTKLRHYLRKIKEDAL